MTWFDELKQVIKVDIKLEKLINIQINSNNRADKVEYNPEKKRLSLNLKKFDPIEKEKVKKALTEAVREDNKILLEQNSEKVIEDFRSKEDSEDSQSLLRYFRDKIPPDDYVALRASLYIRKLFQEGTRQEVIYELKGDIIKEHGKRGLNICNLCSSGYFESWIKPLYDEMQKHPDFAEETFLKSYDLLINEMAFAVFVKEQTPPAEVRLFIENKIKRNLRYGIKFVNIHAIGKENVKKIRRVISELENKYPNIDKKIEEDRSVIFAKLRFEN